MRAFLFDSLLKETELLAPQRRGELLLQLPKLARWDELAHPWQP